MIIPQDITKRTKLFGLNTYEARIWVALLSRNISTAGDLSSIANVPRSRSYDVLESLEKKGFVAMKPGKPIKYLAVPPKEVLENIKKGVEKDAQSYLSSIKDAEFRKLINTLQDIHKKTQIFNDSFVALIKGTENIEKHLRYIFSNSKREAILSTEDAPCVIHKVILGTKNKHDFPVAVRNLGARICVTDEEHILIFPSLEKEVHPDYDLCIWIKNQPISSFIKELLVKA